jgi:hypothetical protein
MGLHWGFSSGRLTGGLPCNADIVLRLPDGSAGRIAMVDGHNMGLVGSASSQKPGGYRVVFVVEKSNEVSSC